MNHSPLNLWGCFLVNHKLTMKRCPYPEQLIDFIKLLAATGVTPKVKPYAKQLETRRFVCVTAMEAGIDLTNWKHKGRPAMSRGLLDMWNKVYQERYNSTYGTAGEREAIRRNVKIKLGALGIKGVKR